MAINVWASGLKWNVHRKGIEHPDEGFTLQEAIQFMVVWATNQEDQTDE